MQTCYREIRRQRAILLQLSEVGGEQQFNAAGLELLIGSVESLLPSGVQFGDQQGFVDLHPFDTLSGQSFQQLSIYRQQTRQQGQFVGTVFCFA